MANGKSTSCYLTIADKTTHKTIFKKVFFKMAELNSYIKTDEFKEKYPTELFNIIKEVY